MTPSRQGPWREGEAITARPMSDPIRRYRALVKAGELNHDPAQERAVEMLELLHYRLRHYKPPGRGILNGLFNGRSRRETPLGLYLF